MVHPQVQQMEMRSSVVPGREVVNVREAAARFPRAPTIPIHFVIRSLTSVHKFWWVCGRFQGPPVLFLYSVCEGVHRMPCQLVRHTQTQTHTHSHWWDGCRCWAAEADAVVSSPITQLLLIDTLIAPPIRQDCDELYEFAKLVKETSQICHLVRGL